MKSEQIYQKLLKIIPDIATRTESGKSVLDSEGMMPLSIDILVPTNQQGFQRVALSHYYKQNGDMIADPDMEIVVNHILKTANGMTFQDSLVYTAAEFEGGISQEIVDIHNDFLLMWLDNNINYGHKID